MPAIVIARTKRHEFILTLTIRKSNFDLLGSNNNVVINGTRLLPSLLLASPRGLESLDFSFGPSGSMISIFEGAAGVSNNNRYGTVQRNQIDLS